MKTVTVSRIPKQSCIRCFLCGGCVDPNLEYLIWEENESRFWLCQKCSSMFSAGDPENSPPGAYPYQN